MAIIPQKSLFSWEDVDNLGDLQRLKYVIDSLPDESLMRKLENERGNGRDDYPVRAMWNSLMAMIVFEHNGVESLRRELGRNGQLRDLCGFDPFKFNPVPSSSAYTRFTLTLMNNINAVFQIFDSLVELLRKELPDFGEVMGIDGKAVQSRARKKSKNMNAGGRGEHDADWGAKTTFVKKRNGLLEKTQNAWFGFKLHTLADCTYELPIAFKITEASCAEQPEAIRLLGHVEAQHPLLLKRCAYFLGDKGYDFTQIYTKLWDDYQIKPVIAIRDMWQDVEGGDGTRKVKTLKNVSYDFKGNVYCYDQRGGRHRMAHGGFEKDRNCIKFRCPALHYGIDCPSKNNCPVRTAVRIPLKEDRRIFVPLARQSYQWQTQYNKRGACERIYSRFDGNFGFENHTIRGKRKMELRVAMAYMVMLAMALGRIKAKQLENIRSLVKVA